MLSFLTYFFKLSLPASYSLLLFIGKKLIIYLSSITIPININIIPHCSFQVKYTLFDNKVIVDKVTFYNKKIYIAPFAIPLFKGKINRIFLSTKSGFIAINDLNIYNIKNSPINIEIKNINLYEILNDPQYKSSYINGKASMEIENNKMKCQINNFVIKNIKVNDISIKNAYINGYYESTDITKNINCEVQKLKINQLKYKNISLDNLNLNGKFNSTNIKKDINCNIKDLLINNIKVNNNSAKEIHIIASCKSNDIKKDINCNIKDLLINNIKVNNNSAKEIHIIASCKSNDIKKDINCNIKDLLINNIKVNNNSAKEIHIIASCNSNNIRKDINCNIKDLSVSNIKVSNNSAEKIQLIGSCNSKDIKKDINCNISELIVNKVKLNNFSVGDIKIFGNCKNNKVNCKVDLQNFKHSLLCTGDINPKLDLLLKSSAPLIINKPLINTNCQYNIKLQYFNNKFNIDFNINLLNNIIKGMNLGTVSLNGNYKNDNLHCYLNLNKWNHRINCNGKVKLDKEIKYNLSINSNSPFIVKNFEISKNLPININSTYNFNVNNINNNIDINGNLELNNGSVSEYLNNINADLNLSRNILNIKLNANIPSFIHGKLEANGNININSKNNTNTNCNINLINGVISNIPVVKGTINANLNLTGNIIKDPLLKGDIIINNPKANLAPVLSGAMLSTQIIEKFIKKDKKQNNKANKKLLIPINTDINIKIDKLLEANGPGLETTWKGGANIKCKKDNPVNWNTKLSLIKGKYNIIGKKLKLTSGEIISNPNIKGLFTIMLAGRKKSNNDVVELKFIQKQNNTQIEFFSQPIKSKQDILALLLFDKCSAELSSSEAYSLAMIIQNLTSGKGSILTKLNDTLKLDIQFQNNTDDSGDEYRSISLGKKFGKWKVSVERSQDNDSTKLSAERKILKQIKANVGVSKEKGMESSLMWSKRY